MFYEFIKSDFTDFDSFIEFLGGDIEPDPNDICCLLYTSDAADEL